MSPASVMRGLSAALLRGGAVTGGMRPIAVSIASCVLFWAVIPVSAGAQDPCSEQCPIQPPLVDGFESELVRGQGLLDQDRNRDAGAVAFDLACHARARLGKSEVGSSLLILVESCYDRGRRGQPTLDLADEAVDLFVQEPTADPSALARALLNRGRLLTDGLNPDPVRAFEDLSGSYALLRDVYGQHAPQLSPSLNALSELLGKSDWAADQVGQLEWFAELQASDTVRGPISYTLRWFAEQLRSRGLPTVGLSEMMRSPGAVAAVASVQLLSDRDRDKRVKGRDLAEAYNAASNVLERLQRYPEASVAAREALRIRLTSYPPGHAQIARSHHNLGHILYYLGSVGEAAAELRRAYDLRSDSVAALRKAGKCSRSTAPVQAREVVCATRDDQAELDDCERLLASSRLALGRLALSTGDLDEALDLLSAAYRSTRRTYGDSRTSEVLFELSSVYEVSEQLEVASCYLDAAIADAAENPEGWRYRLLAAKGRLAVKQGDLIGGLRHLLEALNGSTEFPADQALAFRSLAEAYLAQGRTGTARQLLAESAARLTSVYTRHSELFNTYLDLAEAELDQGSYQAAGATLEDAHSEMAQMGSELFGGTARLELLSARRLAQEGRFQDAFGHALDSQRAWQRDIAPVLRMLPEDVGLRFTGLEAESLSLVLSLLGRETSAVARESAWTVLANSRGRVLRESRERMAFAQSGESSDLKALRAASAAYAQLIVQELRFEPESVRRGALEQARRRLASARREHAEAVSFLRTPSNVRLVETARFRTALPQDAVLVSYVRHESHRDAGGQGFSYKAFVLTPQEPLAVVDLGDAQGIDDLVQRWRETLVAGIAGADPGMRHLNSVGRAIAERVWLPVEAHLDHRRRVFLCADGTLLLLNFAALPATDNRFLVEQGYEFQRLVSETELLGLSGSPPRLEGRVLAMSPSFSLSKLGLAGKVAELGDRNGESAFEGWIRKAIASSSNLLQKLRFRSLADPCLGLEIRPFLPLPEARAEVAAIAEIVEKAAGIRGAESAQPVSLELVVGDEATESRFTQMAGDFSYLHLATHGFFNLRCDGNPQSGSVYSSDVSAVAGLAFSGANQSGATADAQDDDSILLAEEVATLDLRGTQWVVLSACETGLGELAAGEGLLGLARGFNVAGAKTLILSLWPVEDQATREWMSALYRGRFLEGRSTISAVSSAYLSQIDALRARGRDPHPGLWASFVSSGAWQ